MNWFFGIELFFWKQDILLCHYQKFMLFLTAEEKGYPDKAGTTYIAFVTQSRKHFHLSHFVSFHSVCSFCPSYSFLLALCVQCCCTVYWYCLFKRNWSFPLLSVTSGEPHFPDNLVVPRIWILLWILSLENFEGEQPPSSLSQDTTGMENRMTAW